MSTMYYGPYGDGPLAEVSRDRATVCALLDECADWDLEGYQDVPAVMRDLLAKGVLAVRITRRNAAHERITINEANRSLLDEAIRLFNGQQGDDWHVTPDYEVKEATPGGPVVLALREAT
jgi:hypothetical protein